MKELLMLAILIITVFAGSPIIIAILFPLLSIGLIYITLLKLAKWAVRQ